ncbi:phage major capsid protein [[Clostridium] colinum]|uniref:phage major capsid protein n=1 Tax=[Clostridium] colinum TaxID=36835 RepID=UPI002024BD11|nr:phage major capsid protein [[Clostridium] colinum]
MNKKIKELLDSIKIKKQEVENLVNDDRLEEAKKSKEELVMLQDKLDILYDLEEDKEDIKNSVINKEPIQNNEKITEEQAFLSAIKNTALKREVPSNILNALKTTEDEGVLVPQDISTKVRELRRETKSLENLVNVEKVDKTEGSRVIEKNADTVGFEAVDEEAVFPDMPKPEFVKISYKLKKLGGILKATKEFYQATFSSIKGYITKWIAKKGITTRNNLILKAIDDKKDGSKVAITNIDSLKDIINTKLDPAILNGTQIITNQDGFNWLDKLKDERGQYILQPDITQKFDYLLFGKYPVIVFSNKQIKTNANKVPFYVGNLKEFITLFDYEKLFIEMSSEAGELWEKDMIGIKVRERLDVQVIDEDALVKGEVDISKASKKQD